MDQKLTLNDGTEIYGYAMLSGEYLMVYVYAEMTLGEVFELLYDPEKTKKIVCEQFGDKETFRGYKELFSVRKENAGLITAGLRK